MNSSISLKGFSDSVSVMADRLSGLLRPVGKALMANHFEDLLTMTRSLCISIDAEGLTVLYGKRSFSKMVLRGVKRYSFDKGIPAPDSVASYSSIASNELNASGAAVALAIPKSWVMFRTAELPAVIMENISEVISHEIDRLTPFSKDEAFYDFRVLGVSEEKVNILLVAAKRDKVKPYIDALAENGLVVSKLLFDDLSDALKSVGQPLAVDAVLVKSMSQNLNEALALKAAGVLMQALNPSGGIDLLTSGFRIKEKTPLAASVALALAVAGALIFTAVYPYITEERKIEEIDKQIKIKKEEAKKVEKLKQEADDLQKEITTVEGFKKTRYMTVDVLKELTSVLPHSVWLTRTRITDSGVELEGYAVTATEMLPKLEASKYFLKAEFASPTVRDAKLNSDRFSLKMEFEGLEKAEPADNKTVKAAKKDEKK
ncbi:MAG: pilus assembly protein PilM [Nitrospirae bacterium]|nr:pilus assembly protein PilM [Nitrospirota bacterium]